MYFKGPQVECLNCDVFQSLKIILILAKSADPDEILHYVAFHLDIHCLLKYPFRGFQYTMGTVNVLKLRTLKNNYFFRCS